jgi:hypothetical protein
MSYYYYINAENKKDGPHDLVTIMRRIRSGVILPETLFSQGEDLVPAYNIEDLSSFFNYPVEDIRHELAAATKISILQTLRKGWQFTTEHQSMSVFAGGILLLASLFGILIYEMLRNALSGFTASLMLFLLLQSCFLSISLRLYRGQRTDINFIEHTFSPLVGKLAFISVLSAFIIIIGLAFFLVPGVVAMLIVIWMPMLILDYDSSVGKTISAILSLFRKLDNLSLAKLGLLILFYIAGIALIFPIPLIMPILAGGMCSIYEELAAS